MSTCLRTMVSLAALTWAAAAVADDAFYHVPNGELKFTEGTLPDAPAPPTWSARQRLRTMYPYVVLDGEGEAYVGGFNRWASPTQTLDLGDLAIRAPAGRDVVGRVFVPKADASGVAMVRFTVPASAARAEARKPFYEAKLSHYEELVSRGVPGAAWFRHQVREAKIALRQDSSIEPAPDRPIAQRTTDLTRTYDVFSGGRAMAENLQLDRVLQPTKPGDATVELDSIEGVTVGEIDWEPLIKDLDPELDPLAATIPADQHVVFFPSFAAAATMSDEVAQQGLPVMQLTEPRAENERTLERYQRQLCLSIDAMARLLGPQLVGSVAMTGSDPYFPTGTDVAVLFEAPNPALLEQLLLARVALAAAAEPAAKPQEGEVKGVAYHGARSPDRSICSYVARMKGVVVVTNSLPQLGRLIGVAKGRTEPIASLPEYKFFRGRYPRGDKEETALVFLSDATIRRWCGPRWRIATSRRTRDAAVIAELQATHLDKLVAGSAEPGPLYTDLPLADAGQLRLGPSGVVSPVHGTLGFMTPIAELSIDRVTKAEANAYAQWRDRYQRNWRWAFDPIALRLGVKDKKLSADLTVMPLILGTDYRWFVSVTEGAEIASGAGDPHNAPVHVVMAVNPKSPPFQFASNFAQTMAQGITLGWVGSSVAIYVDEDPFWDELAKLEGDQRQEFFEEEGYRVPIAVNVEVSSGLKLTAFLASLRAFVEQTSPGMTQWESLQYKNESYVKVSPTERARAGNEEWEEAALYYSPSGNSLILTPSEAMLKRALDRRIARRKEQLDGKQPVASERPWLGASLAMQVDWRLLEAVLRLSSQEYQAMMQSRAWGTLPILNEWKRRYPDRDPVALHQQLWHTRLLCPGGGTYVWNDEYRTMESTVYGHPGAPKLGPAIPPLAKSFTNGNFGVTFENQGLRARAMLERKEAGKKPL